MARATPTRFVIKEYGNYTLMVGMASAALSVAYIGATGHWPETGTIVAVGGTVAALPAIALAGRSAGKMLGVASPISIRHEITAGGGFAPINREINGVAAFFTSLPFDPTFRDDPDVISRTARYKPEVAPPKWWRVDVMKRADRPTIITVTLYEDLLMAIIEKGWRAQRQGKAHPISQRYLCSLHYEALSGQRLDDITYLAFVKLGEQYRLFKARRQGTSGKLAGSPIWCRRQLGLST